MVDVEFVAKALKCGVAKDQLEALVVKWGLELVTVLVDSCFDALFLVKKPHAVHEQAGHGKHSHKLEHGPETIPVSACSAYCALHLLTSHEAAVDGKATFSSPLNDVVLGLLVKLLPDLIHQYGPQLLDALVEALLKLIKGDPDSVKQLVVKTLEK